MTSFPTNSRSTLGTVTVPSAFWPFSRIATSARDVATAVLFSVCASRFSPPAFPTRIPRRRAWKSTAFEHDATSRYAFLRGNHASRSCPPWDSQ